MANNRNSTVSEVKPKFVLTRAEEYISYLMTVDEPEFYDAIECDDLFEGSGPRERILIFRLPDYEC